MEQKPLVSVILNCYNGEKYLREAIDSVIAQTYTNWEIIFWDNQSTDTTRAIVESYNNPKIQYIYAPTHTLLGEARNLAVEKANGEYINFLDVDDIWCPKKLEEQVKLIEPDKTEVVYTDFDIIVEDEKNVNKAMVAYLKSVQHYRRKYDEFYKDLLENNFIIFSSVLFNKKLFIEFGGVNSLFRQNEDFDILLKLAFHTNFGYVESVQSLYRIHGLNSTNITSYNGLFENRIIFKNIPQTDAVKKAIINNETRIGIYNILTEHKLLKGLIQIILNGSLISLISILYKKIARKMASFGC